MIILFYSLREGELVWFFGLRLGEFKVCRILKYKVFVYGFGRFDDYILVWM